MHFDSTALQNWFCAHKRPLPWREDPSPYRVWISEVMLQQTQVAVVIPYFTRWMERFPTIQALAESDLETVLKTWEGLGYYSRARSLHMAAQQIVTNYCGELPEDTSRLSSLRGIGPYTCGAIQSFAFKKRAAAVDGNVMRVLARYFALEIDTTKTSDQKKIWDIAEQILPFETPWIHNEALIELGATLCMKRPQCSSCPLKSSCQAYKEGRATELPYRGNKVNYERLFRFVTCVCANEMWLLKYVKDGVMKDLWEFPWNEQAPLLFEDTLTALSSRQLREQEHSFTRFRVTLKPTLLICNSTPLIPGYQWVTREKLLDLPFSSGHRRILADLEVL